MGDVKERVRTALNEVLDPHMNVGLYDMGMIRRVDVSDDGAVVVGMVFPCIGCPAWHTLQQEMAEKVKTVEGVRSVKVKIEWDAVWKRNDMSKEARERAGTYGYLA